MGGARQGTVYLCRQLRDLTIGQHRWPEAGALLLAAGLTIDIVFKEGG
jgi:hypothetical protein